MPHTFSGIGDVEYRGKWMPFTEWQERRRYERESQANLERGLRNFIAIVCAIAFGWIIVPGLWNIWRG